MIILTEQEKAAILSHNPDKLDWINRIIIQPVDEILLEYYYAYATKKWPNQVFIYHHTLDAGNWIRKKTRNMVPLVQRPATRAECIDNHIRARFYCNIYTDWNKLIEDEVRELAECLNQQYREFLTRLQSFSKHYSL